MKGKSPDYDIIVVGAGHAGCEAGLAAARMGFDTVVVSGNLDTVAQMSCNPAIGGVGKGQLVREIDALGGEMGRNIDATAIQFKMLNKRKGPAVWSPRAQADKKAYQFSMKHVLENQQQLHMVQDMVEEVLVSDGTAIGVRTSMGRRIYARAVILTTGTFLRGCIHIGEFSAEGGRAGEASSQGLSGSLGNLGFELGRLKTGTPARISRRSVDFSQLEVQNGDAEPLPFSFRNRTVTYDQLPCYVTHTTWRTAEVIRANVSRAPLFTGKITGIGPRYCPSIEDKVMRFPDRGEHQVFLEPEGRLTAEMYVNGASTSLPLDVQEEIVHSIKGLERAIIMRYAYAIEYDFVIPTQLKPNLETKLVDNLFLAGQINGTSGYEEAAAQGIMAGINAALRLKAEIPFILDRSEAYIGVMIDDLVTQEQMCEPYRMYTSRAEYRLFLRQDNADLRLMEYGGRFGLISDEECSNLQRKKTAIAVVRDHVKPDWTSEHLREALGHQEVFTAGIQGQEWLFNEVLAHVVIELKYEGYIKRALDEVERFKRMEHKLLSRDIDYSSIHGLRKSTRERLSAIRPHSIGQASRIAGVSPADIGVLLVWLKQKAAKAG